MRRITSIHALRAFALFGILLIHARQGFFAGGVNYNDAVDTALGGVVKYLFEGRFMLIFNVLFGVSFFIILGKKDYPASKFVWRCFLLALLGLLNRVFFNNDVLFKYGVCGMCLVLIRNMSNKRIILVALMFMLGGIVLKWLNPGSFISYSPRYINGASFVAFLGTYPSSLLMLAKQFLNGDFLLIYSNMCIGYLMGRMGFIESMDGILKWRHILVAFLIYCLSAALFYGDKCLGIIVSSFAHCVFGQMLWYSGAAFYWLIFVLLYNVSRAFHRFFSLFEPYGKLGLTNYTMQGFLGILFFYFCGISHTGISFKMVFLAATVFFIMQAIFSHIWLRFFKNGPLEWLWRCATGRQWLPLRAEAS